MMLSPFQHLVMRSLKERDMFVSNPADMSLRDNTDLSELIFGKIIKLAEGTKGTYVVGERYKEN